MRSRVPTIVNLRSTSRGGSAGRPNESPLAMSRDFAQKLRIFSTRACPCECMRKQDGSLLADARQDACAVWCACECVHLVSVQIAAKGSSGRARPAQHQQCEHAIPGRCNCPCTPPDLVKRHTAIASHVVLGYHIVLRQLATTVHAHNPVLHGRIALDGAPVRTLPR